METGIKSSFIPQSPIVPGGTSRRSGGFNFLTLLALVVFVASATLAVGVFLYAQYLSTSAASKLEQLNRAKQAFEPSLIQDLTRLDDRMRAADEVLSGHIAPSAVLHLLEQLTLQTISFSAFTFTVPAGGPEITMQGIARSVNSIALQADLLSKSGVITNPIFSNIARQPEGVRFDFKASMQRGSIHYATTRDLPIAQPQEASQPVPTSAFGTPEESETPTTPTPPTP